MGFVLVVWVLTRSMRDSETSIGFVQGPPGSRRERVKSPVKRFIWNHQYFEKIA